MAEYAYIAGSRNGIDEVGALVSYLSKVEESWQIAILNGLAGGIKRSSNKSAPGKPVVKELQKLEKGTSEELKKALTNLRGIFKKRYRNRHGLGVSLLSRLLCVRTILNS